MGSDAPTVASGRPLVVSVCSAILPNRLPRVSVCVGVCAREKEREITTGSVWVWLWVCVCASV